MPRLPVEEYTGGVIDPQEFVRTVEDLRLFPQERTRVLVACSGGPDSLCLLLLLWICREQLQLDLAVVTCDHGLRPESGDEAREVQQRAWTLGLPCALRSLDVPSHQTQGESVEMTSRRLRRDAYLEVAQEFQAGVVALGHHMDDQAETVLQRLMRGTGTRGAGGIRWVSPLSESVSLVRPLLGYRRADIEQTLQAWGQAGVEDPSNRSPEHVRNRIRHEVMPLLEEINPGVVRHLAEFAEDQRSLDTWVSVQANETRRQCVEGDALCLEPWRFLPAEIRERMVMGWFREQGGSPDLISRGAWKQLFAALMTPATESRRWELGEVSLFAEGDRLTLGACPPATPCRLPEGQGKVEWAALGRYLSVRQVNHVDPHVSSLQDLSGELTAFIRLPDLPLEVRPSRPGERYRPLGLKGRIKVSDLMINQKLPARFRPVWPVIAAGDEIVWIPGFRVAETWRVQETPCLQLTLESAHADTFCG